MALKLASEINRSGPRPAPVIEDQQLQSVDFDELMSGVGEIGCYQWAIFLVLSLGVMTQAVVSLSYVFVAVTPGHHCSTPELDPLNLTRSLRLQFTIPPDKHGSTTDQQVVCRVYSGQDSIVAVRPDL